VDRLWRRRSVIYRTEKRNKNIFEIPFVLKRERSVSMQYTTKMEKRVKLTENISCQNISRSDINEKKVKIFGLNPNLPCKLAKPGITAYSSIHLIDCK